MKLQGEYPLPFSRQRVWAALLDPAILSRTLPGCEKLERVSDEEFRGALQVQVGPVKGQFQGSLLLSDLRPLEGYHLRISGSGPNGFLNGEGEVRLADTDSGTRLSYDLEAQVGGRIAGVGQRLLESSSKVIARQGLEGLERQLAALAPAGGESAAASAAPVPAAPAPPSQAEFATRFATGLFRELVPAAARPWVIAGALGVLGLLALMALRACAS
jgi:carbon monoxide dehydrogenase subunit G